MGAAFSEIGKTGDQERNIAVDTLTHYSKVFGKRFIEKESYLIKLVAFY
jgi:hypothetical protein